MHSDVVVGTRARRRLTAYGVALVLLVPLQSIVGFTDRNSAQIVQTGRVAVYAIVTAALCIGVLALVTQRWGRDDPDRLAVVVAVVLASFFNFGVLFDPDPRNASWRAAELVVWALLTALLARLAYLAGRSANVRLGLLIFAAAMLLLPSVSYGSYALGEEPLLAIEDPGDIPVPAERPNVYWILLDSYARPDVLKEVADIDVADFVDSLEGFGFEVSSSSRASYPRTILSVTSTLQMEYVLEPGHDVKDDYALFGPVVVGHNRTVARFKALGYQTVYGAAGGVEWSACRSDLVDVCLPLRRPSPATGELEQAMLDLTPLGTLSLPIPYSDPKTLVDGLVDEDVGVEEPFFVFHHILSPHFPYRYRDDCSARAVPIDERSASDEYRVSAYRTQVRCLSAAMEDALAEIIERDPDALIVIQSDHGSEIKWHWSLQPRDWSPEMVTERYSAFNAMRLPERCNSEVEGASLVNTFRIVFACIEGREPDLLDYRAFGVAVDDVKIVELGPERFAK
jgi:hypothetical protein